MSDRAKRACVRVLLIIPSLLVVVTVVFFIIRLTGDPVRTILGEYWTPEGAAVVAKQLGLDRPLIVQYGMFIWNLLRGDMGASLVNGNLVADLIAYALPHTLLLAFSSFFVSVIIAIPLGILAAVYRNTLIDLGAVLFALAGRVIPSFLLGILLMLLFSIKLKWFPIMGVGEGMPSILVHLIMPSIALGFLEAGLVCRMTRSAMLEVLGAEHVRTARAKGLNERFVLWRHVFRNASITIVTVLGLRLARIIGGAVIIETLFVRVGMGRLMVDAIYSRDFPIIQGCILVFAAWVLLTNLVVDLLYGVMDPRVQGV